MAVIYIEGFDKYGPPGLTRVPVVNSLQQEWNTVSSTNNGMSIVPGLSGSGYAFQMNGNSNILQKTLPTSYTTLYFGFRFSCTVGANMDAPALTLLSGATSAFSVWINGLGQISVAISNGGTILATSQQSVTSGTIHSIEGSVTLSTSGGGACVIYLDGAATSISLSSVSWGAASANSLQLGGNLNILCVYDDVYLFDGTGSVNNACPLTGPRVETQFPNSDSAVAFTFGAGVLGLPYGVDLINFTNPGANQLMLRPFTPQAGCTVSSISILPQTTSAVANFKPCIYSDTSGAPHTLLSSGSQVTGIISGTALNMSLTTPQALTGGTQYWIGYITDTAVNLYLSDNNLQGQHASNTYSSGAPATAPTMTVGFSSLVIWGNLSASAGNYEQVDSIPGAGLISYNFSSTVSQEDLFGFPALGSTPNTVYTVKTFGLVAKSDAGARTANLRMKSSATESSGSNSGQALPTSFGYLWSFFDNDPDTGSPWTAAALNSAEAGVQVAS